jgi:hypothetical protein
MEAERGSIRLMAATGNGDALAGDPRMWTPTRISSSPSCIFLPSIFVARVIFLFIIIYLFSGIYLLFISLQLI